MSNEFSKLFAAGLLTVAVVGGAAAYLSSSLAAQPAARVAAADSYTPDQIQNTSGRHAVVTVTEGPAS